MIKAKRYDANSYQLYAGESLTAVAVRYGGPDGDRWKAQDGAGRVLAQYGSHETPRALAKAMSVATPGR